MKVGIIDYKDVATLRNSSQTAARFALVESPVFLFRNSALIATAIKNAREMALLPYAGAGR
jgi:small subunit ribosomal protein S18